MTTTVTVPCPFIHDMNTYHFSLAGLAVKIETPFPILVPDRMLPFFCHPDGDCADYTIRLSLHSSLPQPAENAVWHGLSCYESHNRFFLCLTASAAPFAMVEKREKGVIGLDVLDAYAHYFDTSFGILNRIGMENLLLEQDCLLLHASFIKYNEHGILFSAPSGTGKSTQAELWRQHLGADILNGDRAVLRRGANGWHAWGSPYAGTSHIYRNESAPVRAIVTLRQAKENRLTPLSPAQALRSLYPEFSIHHWDRQFVDSALDLFSDLSAHVPMFLLECRPDEDAVCVLKGGLSL